jgi:hypothetical protein
MRLGRLWIAPVLLLGACGRGDAKPEAPSRGTVDVPAPRPPGLTPAQFDTVHPASAPRTPEATLALRINDSVSVWYAGSRADTSAAGKPCVERVMEIRNRDQVIPVPLLYTGEVPVLMRGYGMRVHLWRHCAPTDLYRVNLQTGQPLKVIE